MSALVANIPDEIWFADAEGHFTMANPAALREFGDDAADDQAVVNLAAKLEVLRADGTPCPPEESPPLRALAGETVRDLEEIVRVPADGELRHRLVNSTPVFGSDGDIIGCVIVALEDVTEQRTTEETLRKMRRLLDEAQAISKLGGWEYDAGTQSVSWTDEVFRIHGVSPGDYDPNDPAANIAFYAPESAALIEEALGHARELGEPYDLELELNRADGRRIWVRTIGKPVVEDGAVVHVTGMIMDITGRKATEAALRESEEQYRSVVERAQDGIVIIRDGIVHFANDAVVRMSGYAREELIGAPYAQVVREDQRGLVADRMKRRLAGEDAPASYDLDMVRKDGSTYKAEIVPAAITLSGAPANLVLIRDVTHHRRAEEEIRRLNAELETLVAMRTNQLDSVSSELEAFAYATSHDVRAPLRAVDGFAQIVVEEAGDRLTPEDVAHLERVRAAAQRMGELLDDLLGLSRVSGRDLQRETVDVSAIARAVGDELRSSHPARHVKLTVQSSLTANADPALVRVILAKLLDNAWKFTAPHAKAHIAVGVADSENGPAFVVSDDGVGFDMQYATHLFGVFQRMHPVGQFEGTGVGLATVQRIVHRHGGRVWAESKVDKGACFSFTLPAAGAPAADGASPDAPRFAPLRARPHQLDASSASAL